MENAVSSSEKYGRNLQRQSRVQELPSPRPRVPVRAVLGVVSFFGFLVNYMLRVNINIAIVAMAPVSRLSVASNESECGTNFSVSNDKLHQSQIAEDDYEFSWDSSTQALILASFYWGYIITPVPGGMLAQRYGSKSVLGYANLVHAVLGLATPFAARLHVWALVTVRVVQGLASGATWPAMHVMASRWIPLHERSKFVSTYMGNSVGTALTFPLCGFLISWLGSWVWAFYVPSVLALLWTAAWALLAFDTPAQHPRISAQELEYLTNNVPPALEKKKSGVPWLQVARSVPFWAMLISSCGGVWTFLTIITFSPTYFKAVHGFNIRSNGVVSGLPTMGRFIIAIICSWFVDSLIKRRRCTVTQGRKLATMISMTIPSFLLLFMGRIGCNSMAEVALLTLIAAMGGGVASGVLPNSVDIAPNFSGTILGLVNIAAMSAGFLMPLMVDSIVQGEHSMERWRTVFAVTSLLLLVTSSIFLLFGTGEVQPWNNPEDTGDQNVEDNGQTTRAVDTTGKQRDFRTAV